MIGFRRTASGLRNEHLFFSVDLILYLEGGNQSFTKEQVYANNFSSETEDIIYWRNILQFFKNDKKIKYKSIGSKITIKEITEDIIDTGINTVMTAMDNEFDEVLHSRIEHPNVFYTHGYSWENDVWSQDVIKAVIEEVSAVKIENNDIENNFNDFLNKIKIAVHADAYLFSRNSSFFNRGNGIMFCIDYQPNCLPTIKSNKIDDKLLEKGVTKQQATQYGNDNFIDTLKFCFGHFLADYCCQVIQHYLKNQHSLNGLQKKIIYRMAIKKHFELTFKDGNTFNHYSNQFNRNGA